MTGINNVRFPGICLYALLLCLTACSIQAKSSDESDTLIIKTAAGEEVSYKVEIADTNSARNKGLMHRKSMPVDEGMLFIYNFSSVVSFWMKNTYVSLDILFIDNEGKIVKIARDTVPLSTRTISSVRPVRYILEVNANQTETRGISVGDTVSHSRIEIHK